MKVIERMLFAYPEFIVTKGDPIPESTPLVVGHITIEYDPAYESQLEVMVSPMFRIKD